MGRQAILLPGIVLPAELAYPALIEALGDRVEARAKELEVYSGEEPAPDYGLETELVGILREAEAAGFERFHLVGYSGGGAISAVFAARYPDRVLSLSLLEPAWVGNEGRSERELRVQAEFDRTWELPEAKLMRRFVELQLAPGVEPPAPPTGPTPGWMAKRPGGIRALTGSFSAFQLDLDALGAFPGARLLRTRRPQQSRLLRGDGGAPRRLVR
jgi:pimeloyl-ACP methyl ester carboxylesterase